MLIILCTFLLNILIKKCIIIMHSNYLKSYNQIINLTFLVKEFDNLILYYLIKDCKKKKYCILKRIWILNFLTCDNNDI